MLSASVDGAMARGLLLNAWVDPNTFNLRQ